MNVVLIPSIDDYISDEIKKPAQLNRYERTESGGNSLIVLGDNFWTLLKTLLFPLHCYCLTCFIKIQYSTSNVETAKGNYTTITVAANSIVFLWGCCFLNIWQKRKSYPSRIKPSGQSLLASLTGSYIIKTSNRHIAHVLFGRRYGQLI